MQNDHPNTVERKFVAVKFRKCSLDIEKVCKSDELIEGLLDKLIFTFYIAVGVAELGD